MKTEEWNGYEIRFVEKEGEWWAVAKDVAKALEYSKVDSMLRKLKPQQKGTHSMSTLGGKQDLSIISEDGIYKVIFGSKKKEAEDFQDWIYNVLKVLRQSSGLEGFQVFCLLDKEHQKEAMERLKKGLRNAEKVDYIKANTIANKAVSNKYGFKKMVKKEEMTPEMRVDRQELLDSVVELMSVKEKYQLNISVKEEIYRMAR